MKQQENIIQIVTSHLSRIFLFQGLSFLGLGVIIYLRPATLVDLVIMAFAWMGVSALVNSRRIKKLGQEISEM